MLEAAGSDILMDMIGAGGAIAFYDPNGRPITHQMLAKMNGDRTSVTESLPLGLGHPIAGLWPAVGELAAPMTTRLGLRYGSGRKLARSTSGTGFLGKVKEIWSSTRENSVDRRMLKNWSEATRAGTSFAQSFEAGENELLKYQFRAIRTSASGGAPLSKIAGARSPAGISKMIDRARLGNRIANLGDLGFALSRGAIAAQLGAMAFDLVGGIAYQAMSFKPNRLRQYPLDFNQTFTDTNGARTQRQRAIMAIHESQLSTRAAIGNEAAFMHN